MSQVLMTYFHKVILQHTPVISKMGVNNRSLILHAAFHFKQKCMFDTLTFALKELFVNLLLHNSKSGSWTPQSVPQALLSKHPQPDD